MTGKSAARFALGTNVVVLLDLVRAAAANLVLLGHVTDLFHIPHAASAGGLGRSLFFILSGFLIMGSSLSRLARPGPYFTPYLINRVARIFTAYAPALVFVAVANIVWSLPPSGQPGISRGPVAFLGNLLLLQDYPAFQFMHRVAGDGFTIRSYNTAEPFWTIPIEFCIYLIFGLVFFGLFGREKLPRGAVLGIAIVALPVVLWNAAAGGANGLSMIWLFGAVASCAWAGAWHAHPDRGRIGVLAGAAALVCLLGRGLKSGWDFQDLDIALCATILFLGLVSVADTLRPCPRSVAQICGFLASYSYSLYLVHNTVLIVVRQILSTTLGVATLPVAVLAAHGAALLLYLAFERHYRHVAVALKHVLAERRLSGVIARTLSARPPARGSWH